MPPVRNHSRGILPAVPVLIFLLIGVDPASARPHAEQEVFFHLPLSELNITEGELPPASQPAWDKWRMLEQMRPYAVLDGGAGEALVWPMQQRLQNPVGDATSLALSIRLTGEARDVSGTLFLPRHDASGMERLRFTVSGNRAEPGAREAFYRAQLDHYEDLLNRGYAGAAWFRHRASQARAALGPGDVPPEPQPQQRRWRARPRGDISDTYELFTGGRAISENLQLDRVLPETKEAHPAVELDSITGITVSEIDWAPLTEGLKPKLDALAKHVPADQHAVFFPSVAAMADVVEAAERQGTPVLRLAEPRSEDAKTRHRYERQLGVTLGGITQLLGPALVRSLAVTGSDPYLRTGSDLALLFESSNATALRAALAARIEAARLAHGAAEAEKETIEDVEVSTVRSGDRAMSSYLATIGDVVVLTNSPAQMRRLIRAHREGQTLASLPEYTFFRARYAIEAENGETAFLMLSDATIRRWCGPKWRIAASRRTRAAAIMSELQASHMAQWARGEVEAGPIHTERPHPDIGELRLTPAGVTSSVYGSLEFLTPIAELEFDRVTEDERTQYTIWRDRYQMNWRWAFDPIAARLVMDDDRVAGDLTVMPLIWGSDYRMMVDASRGAKINPAATDPHEGALLHAAVAVNRESQTMRMAGNFARGLAPGLEVDPLAWVGQTVTLYFDDADLWDRPVPERPRIEQYAELPLALIIESKDALRLAAFLTALRAFADQTAPDMLLWESLKHGERSYVRIHARPEMEQELEGWSIYYAPTGRALIVALSERVLKDALDRQSGPATAPSTQPHARPGPLGPWLGENFCVQVSRELIDRALPHLNMNANREAEMEMRSRSWSNLPILNEWRRLYPDEDPVKLHERVWKTRLVCPGGGRYVWDDQWQTMGSTAYGHPGEPRTPPDQPRLFEGFNFLNFGLTFEEQGLRARASLHRDAGEPE